nr:immunoglobulin heavy chain junction region [Macaca mulatta]MOY22694.1 immunoglobulin heavy chain junction region [Macaca mulatta]MOY24390.1 immunoglobulin heavy chain junction region [Macaca mulatta]MOY27933.1 immunoglobulin heavy chain junction region [Macaca mulatta]
CARSNTLWGGSFDYW